MITDDKGEKHSGSILTHAVRSDGSFVQKLGGADKGSRIITLSSGQIVRTNDETRTKSTTVSSADALAAIRSAESQCLNNLNGGRAVASEAIKATERVSGYRAVKMDRGKTTAWYALDHGCAYVGSVMDFGTHGSSRFELVALTPGEPEASLFATGPEYKEGPPSSLAPALAANCNKECVEHLRERDAKLDARYDQIKVK